MTDFLKRIIGTSLPVFYIWALLYGPAWAQNLTLFMIWFAGACAFLVTAIFFLALIIDPDKIVDDPNNQKIFSGKLRHLWKIVPAAALVVVAMHGWTISAIYWAVIMAFAWILDAIVSAGVKESKEEAAALYKEMKANGEVP